MELETKSTRKKIPGKSVSKVGYVEEDESRRICNKLQVICWYCVKSLRLEVARV